ncbi:hypothetical protein HMPREF1650_06070 [Corynebacterium freneyi DNF00450]|uniref:Uncharacterized protein n=1 Tax=Corynebacterium freneyi DNF00450 TaxID=1287475 RepID=A0A095Y4D4_9CORY|nr:hypothetical protein HMPREF1650_06070 [Corynebacterium freneyi DNF00450]
MRVGKSRRLRPEAQGKCGAGVVGGVGVTVGVRVPLRLLPGTERRRPGADDHGRQRHIGAVDRIGAEKIAVHAGPALQGDAREAAASQSIDDPLRCGVGDVEELRPGGREGLATIRLGPPAADEDGRIVGIVEDRRIRIDGERAAEHRQPGRGRRWTVVFGAHRAGPDEDDVARAAHRLQQRGVGRIAQAAGHAVDCGTAIDRGHGDERHPIEGLHETRCGGVVGIELSHPLHARRA